MKMKIKLSLCLITYRNIKTYAEWKYSSVSLDFGTRWKWVASFALLSVYPPGNFPWYPLYSSLEGAPEPAWNPWEREKSFPFQEWNPISQSSSPNASRPFPPPNTHTSEVQTCVVSGNNPPASVQSKQLSHTRDKGKGNHFRIGRFCALQTGNRPVTRVP
jgi:hypothetical protein